MNYKKILVVMFILCLSFNFYGKGKKDSQSEEPTNVKIIAQSGTKISIYLTVIDLDNNELVILRYNSNGLDLVIRTGMLADPKTQPALNGTDGPFDDED